MELLAESSINRELKRDAVIEYYDVSDLVRVLKPEQVESVIHTVVGMLTDEQVESLYSELV